MTAFPMHVLSCVRRQWLIRQPRNGNLFWTVLFQEGPACTCPAGGVVRLEGDCATPAQSAQSADQGVSP